jgi:biopolymer transport protein ExbB/TolQ
VSRITQLTDWILRLPLIWGGVATLAYYALLSQGTIDSPLLVRYTASHPVEYCETTMFFVGLAALAMRLVSLCGEFWTLRRVTLGAIPAGGQSTEDAPSLLAQLQQLPNRVKNTHLFKRMWEAVEFVRRTNSADDLDQHLRHYEELESIQIQSGYSTIRIIVWAIPILGLLGTVIGITMAVANLNPETLEQSMSKVTHGLGVAFDHTATALALTMVLMFAKAGVERVQDRLLARIDARTSEELVGRFQPDGVNTDPNVAVIRRMSEQVVEAVEALAARQADVWKSSIDETHQQWAAATVATGHVVRDSLTASIKDGLEIHARTLSESVLKHGDRIAASTAHHADRLAASTAHHADRLEASTAQHADRFEASTAQHADRLGTSAAQFAERFSTNAAEHAAQFERSAQDTSARLRDGLEKLAELLVDALHRHGEILTASEKELAETNRQHLTEVEAALGQAMVTSAERQEHLVRQSEHLLKEMQIALVESTGAAVRQQEELVRQGNVLLKVVDATGQVTKLEETLNQNLAALHKTHNFEEAAVALAAAIQLFNARVGNAFPPVAHPARFSGEGPANQAA